MAKVMRVSGSEPGLFANLLLQRLNFPLAEWRIAFFFGIDKKPVDISTLAVFQALLFKMKDILLKLICQEIRQINKPLFSLFRLSELMQLITLGDMVAVALGSSCDDMASAALIAFTSPSLPLPMVLFFRLPSISMNRIHFFWEFSLT